VTPLSQEYPLVEIMEKLGEFHRSVKNMFAVLGKIRNNLCCENQIFEKEELQISISNINVYRGRAIDHYQRLMKMIPVNYSIENPMAMRIKTWCNSFDQMVSLANNDIFDLIEQGVWTKEFHNVKNLYNYGLNPNENDINSLGLMALTSKFYGACICMDNNHTFAKLVKKTKNICGKPLHDQAANPEPSSTEEKVYQWITESQLNNGMKPEEFKPI